MVYTLVPQEPGKFDIPAWDFTYFNPSTKEYVTIPVGGYEMKVAQGASTSAITEQTSIKKEMTDILHIKSSASSAQQKMPSRIFHSAIYWLLYIGAAAVLVAVILIYRRNLKLRADVRGRKLARANRVAANASERPAASCRHIIRAILCRVEPCRFGDYISTARQTASQPPAGITCRRLPQMA